MIPPPQYQISPFGERGWLAQLLGIDSDIEGGLFANAVAAILRKQPGITDAVAGIDSIAIRFAPKKTNAALAHQQLCEAIETVTPAVTTSYKTINIPVLYGGEAGPDLMFLCQHNNLSAEQVIEAHSAIPYRVITLGFAPGFAYLGPLDNRLRAPRLKTPRPHLPAGSIGVAGSFTGIYSLPSPGGWQIIGRTPLKLFEAKSPSPFLFEPGTEVRFQPVSQSEYDQIHQQAS